MHVFGSDGTRCMRGEHRPATKTAPAQYGCDCTEWSVAVTDDVVGALAAFHITRLLIADRVPFGWLRNA